MRVLGHRTVGERYFAEKETRAAGGFNPAVMHATGAQAGVDTQGLGASKRMVDSAPNR